MASLQSAAMIWLLPEPVGSTKQGLPMELALNQL